jgi:hypothetical protein
MRVDMERKAKNTCDTLSGLPLYSHKQNKEVTMVNTVSVHTIKAYRGRRGTTPLILNLVPRSSKRSASPPFHFTLKTH